MKNPCNPVFSNESMYKQFRAKFAIWLPNLKTLDGTDFADDKDVIAKMKSAELSKKSKAQGLAPIPEEKAAGAGATASGKPAVDKSIKAQSGTTAFQFNQKAHRKYNSSKSLIERILKSHSEGNRFIRNEDL